MASRDLNDLQPDVRDSALKLLDLAKQEGLELLIYCTLRPFDEQARLFRQGRGWFEIDKKIIELREKWNRPDLAQLIIDVGPQSGPKVTMAGPGQSMHNYGLAFDAVPLRGGKAVWKTRHEDDLNLWLLYGSLVEEVGLEWAGRWKRFREYPHAQRQGAAWKQLILEKAA